MPSGAGAPRARGRARGRAYLTRRARSHSPHRAALERMVAEEKDDRRYDRRRDYKSESKSDRRPSYHAAIYESDGESMARKLRKLLREDAKAERGDGIRKARETALLSPRFAASRARALDARGLTDASRPLLPLAPARQVFDQTTRRRRPHQRDRVPARVPPVRLQPERREIQELIRRFDVDGDGTPYLEASRSSRRTRWTGAELCPACATSSRGSTAERARAHEGVRGL